MGTLHSFLGYQNLIDNRRNGSRSVMVLDNDLCDAKVYKVYKGDFWDHTLPEGTTPFFNLECTNDQEPRRSTPTITPYWNASYDRPDDSAIDPRWFVDKPNKKYLRHMLMELNLKDMMTHTPSIYKCTIELQAPNFGMKASMEFSVETLGCPVGFYGGNCSEVCACQNGASCHPFNGACKCPDGWKGRACDIKDPKVVMSPTFHNVTSGQTVRLSCEAVSVDPVSTFAWALNGRQLTVDDDKMVTLRGFNTKFNRTFVNSTITVTISSLDMSGEYACAYRAPDGRIYRQFAKVALEGESIALYAVSALASLFLLALIGLGFLQYKRTAKEKAVAMVTKNDPDVRKPLAEFPDMVRRATVENEYVV
ncbi:tyrosine-protein kinase receptor Tie-1-like [Branchiostoma floridae]|uniref:Tyrosine-protein kinase receptor Tie-1-like n=1 Tax=Branchiostoma floridae TaxID=7739 RepID=A0A9J7KSF8_BRAFL|nr:tyrosine-protein kinase receptor Tie-1-like [Branchiostoma floridae]